MSKKQTSLRLRQVRQLILDSHRYTIGSQGERGRPIGSQWVRGWAYRIPCGQRVTGGQHRRQYNRASRSKKVTNVKVKKGRKKSKEVCLIFFNTVHISCTAHFVCLSLSKMLLLAFLYVKATSYSVFDRKTGIYSGQKVSIHFMRKSSYRMYI